MTSMAFHLRHKYPKLEVKQAGETDSKPRPFWDGIYLSNTPLRELLQAHRDYWFKVRGRIDDIPKLKVYNVDLYPTAEKGTPEGFDEINDIQYDVLFHNKTRYDERVANIVSQVKAYPTRTPVKKPPPIATAKELKFSIVIFS